MTTLPPGPETDAKLHELLGREVCRNLGCEGCDASMYLTESGWQYGERDGKHYSTDVSAAISAAEEARKAGRIGSWSLAVSRDGQCAAYILNGDRGDFVDGGDTPAHALSQALCAALER